MDDVLTRAMYCIGVVYTAGSLYFARRTGRIPYGRGRAGVLYASKAMNPKLYWFMVIAMSYILIYSVSVVAFGKQKRQSVPAPAARSHELWR